MENKAEFIKAVGEALRRFSRENILKTEYFTHNGGEFARVTYESGNGIDVCVSGDSCLAIMADLYHALR